MNNIRNINMSQNEFIIDSDTSSLKFNYINEAKRYVVDISHMNLFEATKIAIMCSTYCFLNNFEKKICWLVKDEQTKKAISVLRLRNMEQEIKETTIPKRAIFA